MGLAVVPDEKRQDDVTSETGENGESKLPLQLAIVGRPNVGKSTLLNTLLQEERVLVGPEAGLTRDSIRAQFEFEGRIVYLVSSRFHVPRYHVFILSVFLECTLYF